MKRALKEIGKPATKDDVYEYIVANNIKTKTKHLDAALVGWALSAHGKDHGWERVSKDPARYALISPSQQENGQ